MSVNIPRTFVFTDGFAYSASMLESEISNIIQTINNANAGLLTWDNVKVTTLALTAPLPIASGGTASGATLNNNRVMVSSGSKIVEASGITASRVLVSDTNGLPVASAVTSTTLAFLDATSSIQTQINGKASAPTAGQIVGTATNDNASAGNVGQYIESVVANAATGSSGAFADLTSISLTAGDWDVSASVYFHGFTGGTVWQIGISTTTGNSTTGLTLGSNRLVNDLTSGTSLEQSMWVPCYRMSLSGTTTVYLKVAVSFTGGTSQGDGRISARRMR